MPFGIALLTFLLYSRITSFDTQARKGYDFINWDDPAFVLGNPSITEISAETVQAMFTGYYVGNYAPLSILSYAVDYKLGGDQLNPKPFHLTNLLLHVGSVVLVFFFVYLLSQRRLAVGVIASVLFAVHPMHVESVAWISERRDVLYTFFFVASLLAYVMYIDKDKRQYLFLSLLLFSASLLSKGQAVTLTAGVILIDFLHKRRLTSRRVILEKLPFIALSLVFGVIAFLAQRSTPTINAIDLNPVESFFSGFYAYIVYVAKAWVPWGLSGYHPYPFTPGDMPAYFYLTPILTAGMWFLVLKYFRNDRIVLFGFLFFTLTVLPVLQFLPVGANIIAERYSYLPYLGLFIMLGHLAADAAHYKVLSPIKRFAIPAVLVLCGVYAYATSERIPVFQNSIAFWSDVIAKYPQNAVARNNRGYMYNEFGEYNLAIADFNAGIAANPNYGRLYLNRGVTYERTKQYELALADYDKAFALDSSDVQPLINKGVIYTDVYSDYALGIRFHTEALDRDPTNYNAQKNIGVAYYKHGVADSAIKYYSLAIGFEHVEPHVFYYRGMAYAAKGDYQRAYADGITARSRGYAVSEAVLSNWQRGR
jgi:Flp pilus assembly protein TadD